MRSRPRCWRGAGAPHAVRQLALDHAQRVGEHQDGEAPCTLLLRRHIFLTEVMQPWFFFAYMEAKSFDHRGRRMAIGSELRTQNLIAACLVDGQTGGVFRPTDPTMTASLVKPLLQDWYLKRWK